RWSPRLPRWSWGVADPRDPRGWGRRRWSSRAPAPPPPGRPSRQRAFAQTLPGSPRAHDPMDLTGIVVHVEQISPRPELQVHRTPRSAHEQEPLGRLQLAVRSSRDPPDALTGVVGEEDRAL